MEKPQQKDVVVGPGPDKGTKAPVSYDVDGDPVVAKKRDDPPGGGGDQGTKSPPSYPVEGN